MTLVVHAAIVLLLTTLVAREASATEEDDPGRSGEHSVMSLSQACNSDAMSLCQTSSVYNAKALACMEERKAELTPVCRTWHDARNTCQRDIDMYGACETCPKTCEFVASPLQCAMRLGLKKFKMAVGLMCAESAYFKSLQRLVVLHERRLQSRLGQMAATDDPHRDHIIHPDPDEDH